jgi:hypothetical protein
MSTSMFGVRLIIVFITEESFHTAIPTLRDVMINPACFYTCHASQALGFQFQFTIKMAPWCHSRPHMHGDKLQRESRKIDGFRVALRLPGMTSWLHVRIRKQNTLCSPIPKSFASATAFLIAERLKSNVGSKNRFS